MEEGDEESDKEYVADSADSDSSEEGEEDEFVPETLVEPSRQYLLPAPHPILMLSSIPVPIIHWIWTPCKRKIYFSTRLKTITT